MAKGGSKSKGGKKEMPMPGMPMTGKGKGSTKGGGKSGGKGGSCGK